MRWIFAGSLIVCTLTRVAAAQPATGRITGIVSSSESGRPLEGARVAVVGTKLGSPTRADGRFVIADVPVGTYQLRGSMLGYAPRQLSVVVGSGASATADFHLVQQALTIDQVVVTGYGTSSRRELTGAIASVSGEDITLKAAPTSARPSM